MKEISIPFSEFNFTYSRSGGAGGQNVNKVNSKVTLYWDLSQTSLNAGVVKRFKEKFSHYILDNDQVQITSQRHRTQKANMSDCIEKLYEMLRSVWIPPKKRVPTKPNRSSVLNRLQSKKKDSEKKRIRRKIDHD